MDRLKKRMVRVELKGSRCVSTYFPAHLKLALHFRTYYPLSIAFSADGSLFLRFFSTVANNVLAIIICDGGSCCNIQS